MLHVYHSNRLEALSILLGSLRESKLPADPITPETVLVANQGIGRWLNFKIADNNGIAANIEYILPATFVWQLYQKCLDNVPERSAFEREPLRLRVLHELADINTATDQLWAPIQRYAGIDDGVVGEAKRVQLASRIADVFDQYLVYRPKMLLDWEQGSNIVPGDDTSQRWQPALWRRLTESINEPHRAALWKRFCSGAASGQIDPNLLPPHLHLFNVGLLPPSTLDVLVSMAKIGNPDTERVSLYFLNPAVDYWADLKDMRRAARERLKLNSPVELMEDEQNGNPLLASLGESGRTLMKLLGDRSEWVHDEKFYLPPADQNLLSSVQRDLLHPFESSALELPNGDGDQSIQLHQCYSPLREVQALHDRLLDRFNIDETLKPADVVVMVPDINSYAPVIEAVFGSVGGDKRSSDHARRIPWAVADRSLVQVARVVACVQRLFELPGFEFEATSVLALAAEPAIARRFKFDDSALKTLNRWLCDTGIRRTLAGESRTLMATSTAKLHSWDFGLRRLLLGRAMPAGCGAVGETLPWTHIDGQESELLSHLLDLLDALANTQKQLAAPRTAAEWVDALNGIITQFLEADDDEADSLRQFQELLTKLDTDASLASHTDTFTHAAFAEILRDVLDSAGQKNHTYLTGRVTFSSMVPLRSVPFRMVCMLGLNDGDYPRQRPKLGFDLMAQHPQLGDRSARDDDRYLFLEALLSAREELYLSWIHRNLSDNAEREPSVLVSEFQNYLEKRYPNNPPRQVTHPLQPFSQSLFNPDNTALHTFASEWAPPSAPPEPSLLTETGAETPDTTTISLIDFQNFWNNPSAWYCRRVLGLALWREEDEPEDAEPFEVNALTQYQLRDELIETLIARPDLQTGAAHEQLILSGALPHGGLGDLVFEQAYEEAAELVEHINAYGATVLQGVEIDLTAFNQRLQGRLHNVVSWPDGSIGLLHRHASNLKGKHLAAFWLAHLIGAAAGQIKGLSVLVTKDTQRELPVMSPDDAINKLHPWLDGWNQGQSSALPYFPNTSALLAGALKGKPASAWESSNFIGTGEGDHEAVQLLYPEIAQVPDRPEVQQWADTLLGDEGLKP